MTQKPFLKALLTLSAVLLLSHCSLLEKAIQKPEVVFDTLRVDDFSSKALDVTALLQVKNPNGYGIAIDKVRYQLVINNETLLNDQSEDINGLPAKGETQLALPFTLNSETFKSFKELISKDRIDYTIAGAVEILGINIPFSEKGTWFRPSFDISDIDIQSASFSKVELMVEISIDNPNQSDIPLQGLSYQVASGKTLLSEGKIDDTTISKGKNTLKIPLSFAPKKVASNLFKLMKDPVLPLSFTVQTPAKTIEHDYKLDLRDFL